MTATEPTTRITVSTPIHAAVEKVWQHWTSAEDIIQWNSPSPEWHTPRAEQDLRPGGNFLFRMEAKDGSFGFDFGGVYDQVETNQLINYTIGDGRKVATIFLAEGENTQLVQTFDAEDQHPLEMQRGGWQAILDNFKQFVEKTTGLNYNINIAAPAKKVWETMLHPVIYQEWVNAAWPGSFYKGEWKAGENVSFISEDGSGTKANIQTFDPYKKIVATHTAVLIPGGVEDRDSDIAKDWIGTTEEYVFEEKGNNTQLFVQLCTHPEWAKMFNDGWPKALAKLKEICER